MTAEFLPLRLLLATVAGWGNRHHQYVIDYLMEENRSLREQLSGRRVQLTDDQRRRLATKGQRLGRGVLRQVATIVTPDTILRWYRRLIAQKWTSEGRRPGRPGLMKEIAGIAPSWILGRHPLDEEIIELRGWPHQSRPINHLVAAWGFGEGQPKQVEWESDHRAGIVFGSKLMGQLLDGRRGFGEGQAKTLSP